HADKRALGGGVIAMELLAALARGRADENDVTRGLPVPGLLLHHGNRALDQGKNTIEIYRNRFLPLPVWQGIDGLIFRWPDSVVGDQNINPAELGDGCRDRFRSCFRSGEIAGERNTAFRAQFAAETCCLLTCFLVGENNSSTGFNKRTHGSGPDPTRSAGNQGNTIFKRQMNRHRSLVAGINRVADRLEERAVPPRCPGLVMPFPPSTVVPECARAFRRNACRSFFGAQQVLDRCSWLKPVRARWSGSRRRRQSR